MHFSCNILLEFHSGQNGSRVVGKEINVILI